jgi:hypothetical protein
MGKYVIVKHIKNPITGKNLPVIIIDDQNEIMEFETLEEAEHIQAVFQKNSDSDHTYEIKKI